MVEVIDLLSSPEPCEARRPAPKPVPTKRKGPLKKELSFLESLLEDFASDSDLDRSKTPRKRKVDSLLNTLSESPPSAASTTESRLPSIAADEFSGPRQSLGKGKARLGLLDFSDDFFDPISSSQKDFDSFDTRVAYRATVSKKSSVIILDDDLDELDGGSLLKDPFDISSPPPPQTKAKRVSEKNASDKTAKAFEREAARLRKEREKEAEKERKRQLKEEKEKAKKLAADLAQVNKSKVNRKESTQEMILDMSSSFEESSIGNQVGEYMRHLEVEMNLVPTRIPNMVSWRRKVKAIYNDEAGHWEPCALKIDKEKHALCFLAAKDFVDLATGPEAENQIRSHYQKISSNYPSCKVIYLIEGLSTWMRKNQNLRNRAYQAAVLRQIESESSQGSSNKRTKQTQQTGPVADDDTIEDALLQLQVEHGCLIHHTATAAESTEWIKNFTEHISTVPYRQERSSNMQNAAFCMDTGQVKCGADAEDTYIKMLEEIQRVTAPIAFGVAVEYSCVGELVNGLKACGPLRFQDVQKCANRSGGMTQNRIGPAVSKRLHKIFTSLDPTSTDI